MLNQDLEACPFCDGEAIVTTDNGCCRAVCLDCGASGPATYYSTRGWLKHAHQEAQELWNTRMYKKEQVANSARKLIEVTASAHLGQH